VKTNINLVEGCILPLVLFPNPDCDHGRVLTQETLMVDAVSTINDDYYHGQLIIKTPKHTMYMEGDYLKKCSKNIDNQQQCLIDTSIKPSQALECCLFELMTDEKCYRTRN
jgi:hypothetical protein